MIRLNDKNTIDEILDSFSIYASSQDYGPISKCLKDGAYRPPLEVEIDKELLIKDKNEGGIMSLLLSEQVKKNSIKNTKYEDGKARLYSLVLNQVTLELEEKIKSSEGFDKCEDDDDVVELCKIIKRILIDQKLGNKVIDATVAFASFTNIFHKPGQSLVGLKKEIQTSSELLVYLKSKHAPTDIEKATTFGIALKNTYPEYIEHLAVQLNDGRDI